MPWKVLAHPDLPIVETTYAGIMTGADVAAAAAETLRVANGLGRNRLFADCSSLEGGHTILDLYDLTNLEQVSGLRLREAILQPELASAMEMVRFWETACLNRGFTVRIFADRDEATRWLLL